MASMSRAVRVVDRCSSASPTPAAQSSAIRLNESAYAFPRCGRTVRAPLRGCRKAAHWATVRGCALSRATRLEADDVGQAAHALRQLGPFGDGGAGPEPPGPPGFTSRMPRRSSGGPEARTRETEADALAVRVFPIERDAQPSALHPVGRGRDRHGLRAGTRTPRWIGGGGGVDRGGRDQGGGGGGHEGAGHAPVANSGSRGSRIQRIDTGSDDNENDCR